MYQLISDFCGQITEYPETLADSADEAIRLGAHLSEIGRYYVVDVKTKKRVKKLGDRNGKFRY